MAELETAEQFGLRLASCTRIVYQKTRMVGLWTDTQPMRALIEARDTAIREASKRELMAVVVARLADACGTGGGWKAALADLIEGP